MNSKISLAGLVHFTLIGPDGEIKEDRYEHNLVTTAGLSHIADQLSSSPGEAAMGYMALGSGSTAATAGDTALEGEFSTGGRNALATRTDSGAVVTYTCTFSAGESTGAVTEAGILNDVSAGTLLARLVFGVITKASGDTLAITWTLTFADDGV